MNLEEKHKKHFLAAYKLAARKYLKEVTEKNKVKSVGVCGIDLDTTQGMAMLTMDILRVNANQ